MSFPHRYFSVFVFLSGIFLTGEVFGQTPQPVTAPQETPELTPAPQAPVQPAQTLMPKEIRSLAKEGSVAIPQLQAALASGDAEVRTEAVKALVAIGGPKTVAPLVVATHDNSEEIQIRSTDGLVNAYLPGYLPFGWTAPFHKFGSLLAERFSKRDDRAIEPYVIVSPDVIPALGRLVGGGASLRARANAARAIGILRGSAATPDLLAALKGKNKDTDVLYESLIALQKIGDPATAAGQRFLVHDPEERVQIAAIENIGLLGDKDSLEDLKAVFDRSPKLPVRQAALHSIAMLPDPANRPLFDQYFTDKHEHLRCASVEGIGRLRNAADESKLQAAFNEEPKESVRVSLAFARVLCGNITVSETSPLQYLVNSLNFTSRKEQASELLQEGTRDPLIRKSLYPVIEQGDRAEKIELAKVLAMTGDKETEAHLDRLSRDSDKEVADEGLRALRNLRSHLH